MRLFEMTEIKKIRALLILITLLNIDCFRNRLSRIGTRLSTLIPKRKIPERVKKYLKFPDGFQLLSRATLIIEKMEQFDYSSVDLTGGAIEISKPVQANNNTRIISLSPIPLHIASNNITSNPSLLRVHKMSRKLIKKVPDEALIGFLALFGTELLQREVTKQSSLLPPLMRAFTNTTMAELETKLELLSFLEYNMDPFIKIEKDNLQTKPLFVIDKKLINETMFKIDKEMSPFLSSLIADPQQVRTTTTKIKELVQLGSVLLVPNKKSSYSIGLSKSISNFMDNLDFAGLSAEGAINDWNRIISDLRNIVSSENTSQPIEFRLNKLLSKNTPLLMKNIGVDNINTIKNTTITVV